jgi:hypothetical protein
MLVRLRWWCARQAFRHPRLARAFDWIGGRAADLHAALSFSFDEH